MTAGPHAMTASLQEVRGAARSLLWFGCGMTLPMNALRGLLLVIGVCLLGCQRLGQDPVRKQEAA